jgi:hypothetical protein
VHVRVRGGGIASMGPDEQASPWRKPRLKHSPGFFGARYKGRSVVPKVRGLFFQSDTIMCAAVRLATVICPVMNISGGRAVVAHSQGKLKSWIGDVATSTTACHESHVRDAPAVRKDALAWALTMSYRTVSYTAAACRILSLVRYVNSTYN